MLEVVGLPAPQGSKRHVGRGVLVESSRRVRPWRDAVRAAAVQAALPAFPRGVPVSLAVTFLLPRPASHYGTGRNAAVLRPGAPRWPAVMPDVDKLLRSTMDALGEAGVWHDDAQVVHVVACKAYATGRAGARIELAAYDPAAQDGAA